MSGGRPRRVVAKASALSEVYEGLHLVGLDRIGVKKESEENRLLNED